MRPCPQVQRCGNPLERHRSFRSQPPRDPDFPRIAFGRPRQLFGIGANSKERPLYDPFTSALQELCGSPPPIFCVPQGWERVDRAAPAAGASGPSPERRSPTRRGTNLCWNAPDRRTALRPRRRLGVRVNLILFHRSGSGRKLIFVHGRNLLKYIPRQRHDLDRALRKRYHRRAARERESLPRNHWAGLARSARPPEQHHGRGGIQARGPGEVRSPKCEVRTQTAQPIRHSKFSIRPSPHLPPRPLHRFPISHPLSESRLIP